MALNWVYRAIRPLRYTIAYPKGLNAIWDDSDAFKQLSAELRLVPTSRDNIMSILKTTFGLPDWSLF